MIMEKNLMFSDNQALTATAPSTNSIDLLQDRKIGPGTPLWCVITSRAAPGGTTPTIAAALQTDDASNFPSATTLVSSGTIAGANFAAGEQIVLAVPQTNERHLRVNYTLGGTDPTFSVDAFLTPYEPKSWKPQPDAI